MKKKREEQIDSLYNYSVTDTLIECSVSSCKRIDGEEMDGQDAAEEFYERGWRVNDADEVFCPNCVRKGKHK